MEYKQTESEGETEKGRQVVRRRPLSYWRVQLCCIFVLLLKMIWSKKVRKKHFGTREKTPPKLHPSKKETCTRHARYATCTVNKLMAATACVTVRSYFGKQAPLCLEWKTGASSIRCRAKLTWACLLGIPADRERFLLHFPGVPATFVRGNRLHFKQQKRRSK